MKKLSFAQDDYSDIGLLRNGLAARETDWAIPEDLAVVDLIELYLEIESALSADHGAIVQFVGASSGPGSAQTALDMAWAAVTVLGKKLLVLNCTASLWTRPLDHEIGLGSDSVRPISVDDDLVKVASHEMYMADLRTWRGNGCSLTKTGELREQLEAFCPYFDMVVLVAPPADSDPLGAVLARHVDGNILVIEAEQTRRSSAIRLREILSRCGRPILGAVLHDRRNHVPHWLTRLT